MLDIRAKSYSGFLNDKKKAILEHLAEFPPTIIIRAPKGIYLFSPNIAKVHSTIVLCGAGRALPSVASWFRDQLTGLSLAFSQKDPRASVDVRMLPPVFYPNLTVSPEMILADILIVEIGTSRSSDYVARIDPFGKISETEQEVVIASHKSRMENGSNNRAKAGTNSEESETERETRRAEAVEAEKQAREEQEAEYKDSIRKEFEAMGLYVEDRVAGDEEAAKKLLKDLPGIYPGMAAFLSRRKVRERKFPWVFESLSSD